MADKSIRKIITICGVLIISTLLFSFWGNGETGDEGADPSLDEILCSIEGVDSVNVIYNYADDKGVNSPEGIAVVYEGSDSAETVSRIYELISSLYDIPYNRIYVSH